MSEICTLTLSLEPLAAFRLAPTETMSDNDWVSRAKQGDLQAFEDLYNAHRAKIYALSLRMVGEPSRAEDLTQDSFVRAWQKLASFHGRSSFSTWLHRVAVNVILGNIRSEARKSDKTVAVEETDSWPDPTSIARPEAGIDLERAIVKLPPRARTVFVLHDVEGYRHAEIAEMTRMAEGTSKAHLHRARKMLQKVLANEM